MRLIISTLLIFSTMVSCGSKTDDTGLRDTMLAAIIARKDAQKPENRPQTPPPALTRQAIAHIAKPLLRISAQTMGVKTLFAQVAQNGDYRTYLNNQKLSVTFNSGIITATRGFGLDLLSQGLSIAPRDMFTDDGTDQTYTRTQKQLTKIKKIAEFSFNCTLVKGPVENITIVEIDYPLVTYTETCRNDRRAFKNTYWVEDETGQIWKSAQSIGEQAGFFITEVLVP